MKHFLFALLFYGMPGHGQFMPGTDFYNRNKEICDSMNKSKTITFLRNDSLFGRNIFPHGYPTVVWDTVDTYRFNFNYKLDLARWITDSTAVVANLSGKKNSNDSIALTGFATVYSRNKARDSVQTNVLLKKDNTDSTAISGYTSLYSRNKLRDSLVATTRNTSPGRIVSTDGTTNVVTNGNYWAHVAYNVNIAYALTLVTGNAGVELQFSTDGGTTWLSTGAKFTVNWTVALTISGSQDQLLRGDIPPGAKYRVMQLSKTAGMTITMPTTNQLEIYTVL